MHLLVQNCLDPSRATEIFSVPKRRIFALPKIVCYQNKSGLQYFIFFSQLFIKCLCPHVPSEDWVWVFFSSVCISGEYGLQQYSEVKTVCAFSSFPWFCQRYFSLFISSRATLLPFVPFLGLSLSLSIYLYLSLPLFLTPYTPLSGFFCSFVWQCILLLSIHDRSLSRFLPRTPNHHLILNASFSQCCTSARAALILIFKCIAFLVACTSLWSALVLDWFLCLFLWHLWSQ